MNRLNFRTNDALTGVLAMIGACLIWGMSPLYYKQLNHVPPLEVLGHRSLWSLAFFGLVLAGQGRLHLIWTALNGRRRLGAAILATVLVSTNLFLFIWAIQVGRAVEASLGYYILPLVSVLMGVVFFGEGLSRGKILAVALAGAAVVVLTVGLGTAPYLSLVLAITFGIYTALKKNTVAGPVVSVTTEVMILAPMAAIWLWGVHNHGWVDMTGRNLATFGHSWHDSLLLIFSGPMTATPMILFSYASRRVRLSTVGLVSYLNPTLQFLLAVLIFAEPFTIWHSVAFPLIWAALAVYSVEAVRQERSARRASISVGTVEAVLTNPRND